jgi:GTP-binding protein
VHLLDVGGALLEGRDPLADYATVRAELGAYGAGLDTRTELVALNKVDLVADRTPVAKLAEALRGRGREVYPVSGATGEGVAELLAAMAYALEREEAR